MNVLLYVITVLIWGNTWIAIKFQIGDVAVENSILYRFVIAAVLLFAFLLTTRKLHSLSKSDHFFCALQGFFLFCANFYCLYKATVYIESGLVSVIFSMSTVFNAFNNWICYTKFPARRTIIGSAIGVLGILLIFSHDIFIDNLSHERIAGILLAAMGTYFFSCGNIVTVRHKAQNLPLATTNAWGMLYGAIFMAVINIFLIGHFSFSTNQTYLLSLFFLAIPGTIIVFTTYLGLIRRIGPDKAAYATVIFPVVALTVSFYVENYKPTGVAILGLGLALAGNLIVFYRPKTKKVR